MARPRIPAKADAKTFFMFFCFHNIVLLLSYKKYYSSINVMAVQINFLSAHAVSYDSFVTTAG